MAKWPLLSESAATPQPAAPEHIERRPPAQRPGAVPPDCCAPARWLPALTGGTPTGVEPSPTPDAAAGLDSVRGTSATPASLAGVGVDDGNVTSLTTRNATKSVTAASPPANAARRAVSNASPVVQSPRAYRLASRSHSTTKLTSASAQKDGQLPTSSLALPEHLLEPVHSIFHRTKTPLLDLPHANYFAPLP